MARLRNGVGSHLTLLHHVQVRPSRRRSNAAGRQQLETPTNLAKRETVQRATAQKTLPQTNDVLYARLLNSSANPFSHSDKVRRHDGVPRAEPVAGWLLGTRV